MYRILWTIVLVVVLALLAAGATGSYRWQHETSTAIANLECCAVANPLTYDPLTELARLPAPVRRYFEKVLRPGQVMIRRAHHTQEGEFRRGGDKGAWARLSARQTSVVHSPGFVWDARIAVVPALLPVQVRDLYSGGKAEMSAKILGLVTMAHAEDAPELASAALQRHLGEAMWFPTALLPSQGVVWTELGTDSARATLTDKGVTASLEFRFAKSGEIVGTYTDARFQEANGRFVAKPWEAVCSDWAERGGMLVPLRAEVAWIENGKRVPYWRARVVEIEFE
jgi:hypothetical protein